MDRRDLNRLFGPGSPHAIEADLPDRVLLDLLVHPQADRPAALAEVARRYAPLVWDVCRRSLREPADAEDAFQATLLALLEHPGRAARARSLPAWLHGVALRISLKLRRTEGRHRARAARSARPEAASAMADSTWVAAARALDEELARLPASLRTAFLTCDQAAEPQAELAARARLAPRHPLGPLQPRPPPTGGATDRPRTRPRLWPARASLPPPRSPPPSRGD